MGRFHEVLADEETMETCLPQISDSIRTGNAALTHFAGFAWQTIS